MSRFFRNAGDSSSEDSSSEEEILYSGDEEEEQEQEESEEQSDTESDDSGAGKKGASKYLKGPSSDSESSDDDERDQVKSAKDKRFGELNQTIKLIENGAKIGDWNNVANEFDKLNRQVAKIKETNPTPKMYIECIAELEGKVAEATQQQKTAAKKMNAQSARGFNTIKQRLKKNNKEYQDMITLYREDKLGFMESDEEEEPAPKPTRTKPRYDVGHVPDQALDDDEGFETVDAKGRIVQFTPESIFKHLKAIMEARGKKNTEPNEQIKVMEKLNAIASTPYQRIRVLLTMISSRFDLGAGTLNAMPLEHWKGAEKDLSTLLTVLHDNPQYIVLETAEEWEDDDKPPVLGANDKYIKVPGSIVSYIDRLDEELTRSLQHIDPHTPEYIDRLRDESEVYNIIVRGLLYYETLRKDESLQIPQESLNRIVMRRLEHIYFKPATVVKILEDNSWKNVASEVDSVITPRQSAREASNLVSILSNYLFTHSEGIIKARAMLCYVYFLALHDHYYVARDMMLMSHLQDQISQFDITTQILYNRSLVQVGLCAFRKGLVHEAQNTLQDICGSGRQKELLAQGVQMQRFGQVSPEQERLERQRQLPFHLHINLELLECVYLTCSMLLEIPLLAQTGSSPDVKKRVISKTYRRMLEYHERQIFTGPPENTRDHIMQASKALAAGEWKKAIDFIHAIKIWELIPGSDNIREMLSKQIQEEGLRTYLFTYAPYYDTLSLGTLVTMFELDTRKVSAIVSRMISHEELHAALDQVSSTIIFRKGVELSRLQSLSLTLASKASSLIETNERTLEQRTQGSSNAFERQGGRGRGGGRGGGHRMGRGGARTGQRQAGGTTFTGGALGNAVRG